MNRRNVLSLLPVALLLGGADDLHKKVVVGLLMTGTLHAGPLLAIFKEELARYGYVEGINLRIELRSARGRTSMLSQLALELVDENVDVIVAWLTPAVQAAALASSNIPIVMAGAGDPVATGLVSNLARPNGNITGMASVTAELAGKNVELLRRLSPKARRLMVVCNGLDTFTDPFLDRVRQAASFHELQLVPIIVRTEDDFEQSLNRIGLDGLDALIVQPSLPTRRAAELALGAHVPSASPTEDFARDGGLIAYSGLASGQYQQAARYVARILKGARPADLPIQQPVRYGVSLNLRTARVLGLEVPADVLVMADEIIEVAQ